MEKERTNRANIARTRKADEFALNLLTVYYDCLKKGPRRPRFIIQEFERRGITPPQGGKWSREQEGRVWKRIGEIRKRNPDLYMATVREIWNGDSDPGPRKLERFRLVERLLDLEESRD